MPLGAMRGRNKKMKIWDHLRVWHRPGNRNQFPELKRIKHDLKHFWRLFNNLHGINERIELLSEYAERKYFFRYPKLRYVRVRKSFSKKQSRARYRVPGYHSFPCKVCGIAESIKHHIIQVQHGGDNRNMNLIRVCESCHAAIHPWLEISESKLHSDKLSKEYRQFCRISL